MSGKENNNVVIIHHPAPTEDIIKNIEIQETMARINASGGHMPLGHPTITHNNRSMDSEISNLELYNRDRVLKEEQMNAMISGTNVFTNISAENDIAFATTVGAATSIKYLKNSKYSCSTNGSTDGPPKAKRKKARANRKKKRNAKRN